MQNVRKVFKHILKHGLFVKFKKYIFSILEISFLGFIITTKSMKINLSQVSLIEKWLIPKIFCNIHMFLGFGNFYCQFSSKIL